MGNIDAEDNMLSEIEYWEKELSLEGAYPDAIINRTTPERMNLEFPFYLMEYFIELTERGTRKPKVIDVGSGPLSMLNYGAYHNFIELTCADPLGNVYKDLLHKYNRKNMVNIIACAGERLTERFGHGVFDMVWMHNAIDHSDSPTKVFQELVTILRPGGYLVVQGWAREGTAEGWNGLHQHDIYILPDAKLMCQSKVPGKNETVISCMNEGLPLVPVYLSDPSLEPRTWIRTIFRKHS